jgi:Fe-S-cluster formation regulator IscX/YfhJ
MPSSTLHLSPFELCNSIVDANDVTEITEILNDHPHLHPRFVHFHSVYKTIANLERLAEQHRTELYAVFDNMKLFGLDNALSSFITRKRKDRYSPYRKRVQQRSPTVSEYECYSDGGSRQPPTNFPEQHHQRTLRSHKSPSLLSTPHPMTRRSQRKRRLSSLQESLAI